MLNAFTEINWLAVIASTLLFAVLGGVWFGAVVAKPYAAALGLPTAPAEGADKPKMSPVFFVGPLVCSLFVVLASAVLIGALDLHGVGDGILFGVIVGVGYLVATVTNVAINPLFPRPFAYAAVTAPYFLVSSVLASIILTLWR